ncbi:MAG: COQ9 family protein [Limimaricola sp.]|uniref:COQ9 family protein n=1 Tax=Limimaricola sp. TaxID=2211665 RepID=UPI001DB36F2B|nr:COQ9 family protein [Limimaricola sp.]MBI1417449.1 COQ9 family protein [Limimaricola sp.]
MSEPRIDPAKDALLDAILPHVVFDGWAPRAFDAAVAQVGMDAAHARTLCPRGAVDLAIAYHQRGDAAMLAALHKADMSALRYSEKVSRAIRLRLDAIDDKEVVRRGTALFALPHLAADGARLVWGTADLIWDALGDTSDDVNWYSKRAILSAVYASCVLYWLGDQSEGATATDAFIARRIENVMQVEKAKAQARGNRFLGPLVKQAEGLMSRIKAPPRMPPVDLPGIWAPRGQP